MKEPVNQRAPEPPTPPTPQPNQNPIEDDEFVLRVFISPMPIPFIRLQHVSHNSAYSACLSLLVQFQVLFPPKEEIVLDKFHCISCFINNLAVEKTAPTCLDTITHTVAQDCLKERQKERPANVTCWPPWPLPMLGQLQPLLSIQQVFLDQKYGNETSNGQVPSEVAYMPNVLILFPWVKCTGRTFHHLPP